MSQRIRVNNRAIASDSKFYLPAWSAPSVVHSRLKRAWGKLFNHGIGK